MDNRNVEQPSMVADQMQKMEMHFVGTYYFAGTLPEKLL